MLSSYRGKPSLERITSPAQDGRDEQQADRARLGDRGEQGSDVLGAELGLALREEGGGERGTVQRELAIDQEVIGGVDRAGVIEVAVAPAGGQVLGDGAVDAGVVIGV